MERIMKKCFILFCTIGFLACSSSVNNSSLTIFDNAKIRSIKNWSIEYDTVTGYSNTTGLILNESTTTVYDNPYGVPQFSATAWETAEKRGLKLTGNIKSVLTNKKLVKTEDSDGLIKIHRPLFFEEGRYILHVMVNVFDNTGTKLAEFDLFNDCRAQNEKKGVRCVPMGDIKNDEDFAIYCSNKIFDAINP